VLAALKVVHCTLICVLEAEEVMQLVLESVCYSWGSEGHTKSAEGAGGCALCDEDIEGCMVLDLRVAKCWKLCSCVEGQEGCVVCAMCYSVCRKLSIRVSDVCWSL